MTATEITRTGYFYKYTCSDRLIDLCILRDACHELFCIFGDFYASGMQDAEVTKSLTVLNSGLYKIQTINLCNTQCSTLTIY